MQSLDVQSPKQAEHPRAKGAMGLHAAWHGGVGGKTGAETARNGSSFLAIIERMVAGAMDGKPDALTMQGRGIAGRGAGDAKAVPGERHTLNNRELGKDGRKASSFSGKNGLGRPGHPAGVGAETGAVIDAKAPVEDAKGGTIARTDGEFRLPASKGLGTEAESASSRADAAHGERKSARGASRHDDAATQNPVLFVPAGTPGALDALKANRDREGESPASVKGVKPGKGEKKAVITVRDERTQDGSQLATGESPFSKTVKLNGDGSADMTIAFRNVEGGKGSEAGETAKLAEKREGEGKSFASMLSQELRNNAADFVKTGAIVLRDNNAGTIRLTLHPESLGSVQIKLELSGDRKISGKIVVSSEEAYEAFNESLSGLSDAFVEGGFESAGFDLAFAGGDPGSGSGKPDASGSMSSPFYASSIPDVMSARESADTVGDGYPDTGFSAINVYA